MDPPWYLGGLLDEPAHVATALLVLANLPPAAPAWTGGYAAGTMAVDVDHLPLIRVRETVRKKAPRPPVHTLLLPAGLVAAGAISGRVARQALLGASAGTCVHFLRDLFTGTGLAPLQPLISRRMKAPRKAYELAMALLAARASRLPR